jgi:galactonate dehydratase
MDGQLKIDRIRTWIVDSGHWKNWLFVRVDTSDGVHGWGEAFTEAGRERGIAAEIEAFGGRLVGRDPLAIRAISADLSVDAASRRRSLEFCSALSGLEIALWDIAGKVAGWPVHRLLGGPTRDHVHVYANCHDGVAATPAAWAALCARYAERGFGGVKIYPVTRPPASRADEDAAVAIVGAVREAVGPDVEVMIDLYRALTPAAAIRFADRVAEFRPYWLEEPVAPDQFDALAEVRARSPIPVLTGESLFGRVEFRELFARRGADLINPDVCNCGGILELTEIGAWADAHLVPVSPHNWNSLAIGLAATIQASACIRDVPWVEHISAWTDRSAELTGGALAVVDGTIAMPTGPGLGVDLDEAVLARYPMREYTRLWPD